MKTSVSNGKGDLSGLPAPLRQAVGAHQSGDLDGALEQYRIFLSGHPSHPTALQLLGLAHLQRQEYEEAIQYMGESLKLFPDQPEVVNNLANALAGAGRLKEAVDTYGQAIRLFPRYAEAYRNLGLCYLQIGIPQDARVCFQRCIDIAPDDVDAWLGLGNATRQLGDLAEARRCYERAIALDPGRPEPHHNLGVCLRMLQAPREAIEQFQSARALGLDRGELYQNLGSALVDAGEMAAAVDAYRQAIARNPQDPVNHWDLNKLLWEQGWLDEHLASYDGALEQYPTAIGLRTDYAMALNQAGKPDAAERVLVQGLRHVPDSAQLRSALAHTFELQDRWNDALQMHLSALRAADVVPDHRISYARALLACKRPDEALAYAETAAREVPLNQRAIAYLCLCWRLLGDERDAILNDYQGFVRVFDVPVPARFGDARAFNAALGGALDRLHVGKQHPPEQTLRGGIQTHGNLLGRREPEIMDLTNGITECVRDYIRRLPYHATHPLLSRRDEEFRYAASWSVKLAPGGYHTNHIHPLGWISSAYYVHVPAEVSATEEFGGGIKFGEPDIDIGDAGAPRRKLQPVTGQLVLFPSYMWHGTIPFTRGESRMTVAFDVVPRDF